MDPPSPQQKIQETDSFFSDKKEISHLDETISNSEKMFDDVLWGGQGDLIGITEFKDQPLKEEMKMTKMVLQTRGNLFSKAFGNTFRTGMCTSLSKPSFCPSDPSLFAVGTEEQDPRFLDQNRLILASVNETVQIRSIYTLPDHVRDIQWIDGRSLLVAVNHKLALVRLNTQLNGVENLVMFPEFHRDTIREIDVTYNTKHLVISGGFDGNVFVTDVTRLCLDIQKNEKKSENSLYPCRDVVGSVSWHIEDPYLASCTTDTGTLHIFDIRTDKRRPAIVYDTAKKELYAHGYQDRNTIFLGFGDGAVQIFDLRMKRTLNSFQDPHQRAIGEIKFDQHTKNFAIFGQPKFTLYSYEDNVSFLGHYSLSEDSSPGYKTSGDWNKHTHQLGVTDSFGEFALFSKM